MKFEVEILKLFSHFDEAVPIYLSAFVFYCLITLIGVFVSSLFKKQNQTKDTASSFFQFQTLGSVVLLFLFSIINFHGKSIHTLLLIPAFMLLRDKKISFSSEQLLFDVKAIVKPTLFTLALLFILITIQFVKYDFFNPTVSKTWGDYSYYAALSKAFLLSHEENSYLSLPFFDQVIAYRLYHFSDIELTSLLTLLFPKLSALLLYAYVYIPVFIVVLLNALVAFVMKSNHNKNQLLYAFILLTGVLVSVFFNFHIHKSLLPFSLLCILFTQSASKQTAIAVMLSSAILNPICIVCFPIVFFVRSEYWIEFTRSKQLKTIMLEASILAFVLMVFLAYQHYKNSHALKTLEEFILFEKAEVLYPLLASTFLLLMVLKPSSRRYSLYAFTMLYLLSLALLPYSNLLKNYESWQLHQTAKNFVFIFAWVVALRQIMLFGKDESAKKIPKVLMKLLPLAIFFLSLQNFRYLYGYNRQFYYGCAKIELKQTEQLLSNNECIGTYLLYPNETERLAYFTQRAAFTYPLYYSSLFAQKQVWLTNIHLHQQFNSLKDVLKKNWESSLYYTFQKDHAKKADAVIDFIHQYRIQHIISNCESDSLPTALQGKVTLQQQFYVDSMPYFLYRINEH